MELHRFESFGAFEGAVVDVDLKVRLLGPRDGKWQLGHADVDGITIQQGVEAVPNLCEASGWPTHLMFLVSEGPSPTWLNGIPFARDRVGILAPRKGFVFRAAGPNAWVTIALPLSSRLFHADDDAGHVLRSWSRSTSMPHVMPDAVQSLRNAALLAAAGQVPRDTGRALIENAIAALVYSRRQRLAATGRPGASPHDLCNTTLDLFRAMDTARRYSDGFASLPLGARSIRSFFHHCYGLGPVQYLHLRRLHAIYIALQDMCEGSASIADTFERHGYSYSTYALTRYRSVFGETPSATRARMRKK